MTSFDYSYNIPSALQGLFLPFPATANSLFYTQFHTKDAMNEHIQSEIITIEDDDDDDDVIILEPTKRQKTEFSHLFKSNKSSVKPQREFIFPERATPESMAKSCSQAGSKPKSTKKKLSSHHRKSNDVKVAKSFELVDDTTSSLTMQDHVAQTYSSVFEGMANKYSSIVNSMSSPLLSMIIPPRPYPIPPFRRIDDEKCAAPLIAENQSPVSTNGSTTNSSALDCGATTQKFFCNKEDLIYSKEATSAKIIESCSSTNVNGSENNASGINKCTPIKSSESMRVSKTATIPNLDLNTCRGQRIKRKLRSIWKPECINSEMVDEYLSQVCCMLHQNITNEEKALRLLMVHSMNIEETLKEVQQNKMFYQNYFKCDPRVLRSRIPLF